MVLTSLMLQIASEKSSSEVENSATEISTDSEFEHDTPTRPEIPDILTAHRRKPRPSEQPKRVQVNITSAIVMLIIIIVISSLIKQRS